MTKKSPENYDDMMRRILAHECGSNETDEYAADTLEFMSEYRDDEPDEDEEYAEDIGIGKSKYFSTCDYTMIGKNDDEDSVNYQGS